MMSRGSVEDAAGPWGSKTMAWEIIIVVVFLNLINSKRLGAAVALPVMT